MIESIGSLAELEAVIGRIPPPVQLKVIDHLDRFALDWLEAAPLAFAGFGDGSSIAVTLAGGRTGFAGGERNRLHIPLTMLDEPGRAVPGLGFCSLFLAPGIGETLRINGRVADVTGNIATIAVEECYVHCAKALIRSGFWAAQPVAEQYTDPAAFMAASPFMALVTIDADRRADLSPKGDPPGKMLCFENGQVWFADRPGNRRADSFRNIITQPRVAAVILLPGSSQLAVLCGTARLTRDIAWRSRFAVQGKVPALAACVEDVVVELRDSAALERAGLWPVDAADTQLHPAKIFAAHVRLNKDKGLAARLAGAFVSIPGLMQAGLDNDYKSNLY